MFNELEDIIDALNDLLVTLDSMYDEAESGKLSYISGTIQVIVGELEDLLVRSSYD